MKRSSSSGLNITMGHEELADLIRNYGLHAFKGRQVVMRLRDLLPSKLQEIKKRKAITCSASQALREALVEKNYRDLINNYVEAQFETMSARVNYETHYMLFLARQSLRKAQRIRNTPR